MLDKIDIFGIKCYFTILPIISLQNEKELLAAIAKEDEKSFAELFYGYYGQLTEFVLLITGSVEETDEIVQEIFVKVWEHRKELPGLTSFNSWIFIITRNQTVSAIRKINRESKHLENLVREAAGSDEIRLDSELPDMDAILVQAIEKLPPQQKRVFQLKQQGKKNGEIANELGISSESVRKYQQWALKSITEFVKATAAFAAVMASINLLSK